MGSGGGSGCEQTLSQVVHTGESPSEEAEKTVVFTVGCSKERSRRDARKLKPGASPQEEEGPGATLTLNGQVEGVEKAAKETRQNKPGKWEENQEGVVAQKPRAEKKIQSLIKLNKMPPRGRES